MERGQQSLTALFSRLADQPIEKRTRGAGSVRVDVIEASPPSAGGRSKATNEEALLHTPLSTAGKSRKKARKILQLISRHEPSAPGGYFRYKVAADGSSVALPLDELLERYGDLA